MAHLEPLSARQVNWALPAELEPVLRRCMAKNPAERYESAGKLAKSFALSDNARRNTPARLMEALGTARHAGVLPSYPLGSDMTGTEERLAGALSRLKTAGYVDLARSIVSGFIANAGEADQDALRRMALDAPQSLSERALRALVLGALQAQQS